MARFCRFVFWLIVICSCSSCLFAQDCPVLVVPKVVPGTNMFNEQQEVWLGDAEAASLEQSITIVDDAKLTDYLQHIVDRLALGLGSSQLQFRVKIYDAPTGQAFSLAGGRIYVSRKLIALTRNEDEVSGILAHEMGHSVAHHEAIDRSEAFRKTLGVQSVGDRADVAAKWNDFLSNYRRQKPGSSSKAFEIEEREQVQADTVALYLVSRADYSPQSFFDVFDRTAQTKGNVGGFWSNLFGTTSPDAKRLGKIIKDTPAMPAACVSARSDNAVAYQKWKTAVIEYSGASATRQAALPGLVSKRVLTERLRPEIQDIRISPDGKYVLAQDDSNAFVLERKPLKAVFHFDAPEAAPGQFTPDSRGIVLLFDAVGASPRVERWDIASQKRLEVHEIYTLGGCDVSKVAPDGKTLACLTREVNATGMLKYNLDLYDVATGASFYHKKAWVDVDLEKAYWNGGVAELVELLTGGQGVLEGLSPMAFSGDGHYFVGSSRRNFLAMDLIGRRPIDVPATVKNLTEYSFTFLGDNLLAGVAGSSGEKSGVVHFPDGAVVYKDLSIGGSHLFPTARGDHILLRPIKDHPVGIFDVKQNKIVVASKRSALDVWDNEYIAERLDGDLMVFDVTTTKPIEHAQLPDAPLGTVWADAVAPDLSWLAVSQKTRGAVWNLQSGERMYHVRGFSAAYFSPDQGLYLDFPRYLTQERTLARASLQKPEINVAQDLGPKKHASPAGRYLMLLIPGKENVTQTDVDLQAWDIIDEKVVWKKHFPQERPAYHVDQRANSLILYWQANSQAVKAIAKEAPEAAAALSRVNVTDRDTSLFVQVVDLDTGTVRADLVISTGKESFRVKRGVASRDRLIVADNQNRVLVYSFDGQLVGTVAGHSPEISAKADRMTVRTESGKLELYDLRTVQLRNTFDFGCRVSFNGFSADGSRLLVLTADQVVYTLNPTDAEQASSVAAK
jgi:hypothetical protein